MITLSNRRLHSTSVGDARNQYARDRDRVIFSSAFRRLQDKTQVFPMARADFVRTRLTHSIEVASVARSILSEILAVANHKFWDQDHNQAISELLEATCLAHDLGNPPFGHFGEEAIRQWFILDGLKYLEDLPEAQKQDFLRFEGNAQGLRTILKLANHEGLKLSADTIAAFVKYPWVSTIQPHPKKNKFGIFQSEIKDYREVAKILDLKPIQADRWGRHPLVYIMEAADDLCYRLIDYQDGVRLKKIAFSEAQTLLSQFLGQKYQEKLIPEHELERNLAVVFGIFTQEIAQAFCDLMENPLAETESTPTGLMDKILWQNQDYSRFFTTIAKESYEKCYSDRDVIKIELAGQKMISSLLSQFVPAILNNQSGRGDYARILKLLPQRSESHHTYDKLQRVTDYICGMTDSFACNLYQELGGLNLY